MKKIIEFLKAGLLLLLLVALIPQVSYAADGEIFTILETKIYNTLMDLREIVYVIAGFGLVMFAVMAIFNKISYKHLSYIMIGLSLLSLMFPFIEYFSGYTTQALSQQKELTFKSFLDPRVSMERIQGTGYKEVLDPSYDGSTPEERMQAAEEADFNEQIRRDIDWEDTLVRWEIEAMGGPTMMIDGVEVSIDDVARMQAAGCGMDKLSRSSWNMQTGTRNVCTVNANGQVTIQQEACQGKFNEDGTCSKTLLQTVGDIWSTVQNGIGLWNNLGNAFDNTGDLLGGIKGALNSAGDIVNGNGTLLDKLQGLSNLAQNSSDSAGRSLNGVLGGLMSGAGNIGNTAGTWSTDFENNPNGANNTSDVMNALSQWMNGMQNNVSNAGSTFNSYAGVGNALYGAGQNIDVGTSTFGSAFSKLGSLFGH
ncbi:MAG: hypothetical protein IJ830_04295 [Alphaproteobacteria bacterium]|nr:hypothetical protein [Alphaproteobacteria bacterium]